MEGMQEKANGWIFCDDFPPTTPLTSGAYQKRLTAKQVNWLVDVNIKINGETPMEVRGGRELGGWIESQHWNLFIFRNGSGILTIKQY